MTTTVQVELGERSYPIVIGHGLIGGGFDLAACVRGRDCLIVSNATVAPLYLVELKRNLNGLAVASIELEDGEAYKTLAAVESVIDRLAESGANRDTCVIALGGGVVGDIAGFSASVYMRGVDFIQVPTTLLAQVDASVGGKTGVNHRLGKNLLGAFHQPRLVLVDTDTLVTLPARELKAGLAEVIKHGAVADAVFFAWLEEHIDELVDGDTQALAYAVQRSCEIKAAIVAEDEREAGRRAILNFGHTFGHAIENCQGYGEWLHGEAVAAGMVMAAALSDIDAGTRLRLGRLIERAGLPVTPPPVSAARMRAAMGMDKKVIGRKLRFVLLERLGAARTTSDYDDARLDAVLEACNG